METIYTNKIEARHGHGQEEALFDQRPYRLIPFERLAEVSPRDQRDNPADVLFVQGSVEAVALEQELQLGLIDNIARRLQFAGVVFDPAARRQVDDVEGQNGDHKEYDPHV